MDTREYLEGLLYQPAEVDKWLAGEAFPFSKYDPELGYLHRTRRRHDGIDDSTSVYTYDAIDARRTIRYAELPCRINSYGNSFTNCEQVSDGETWQEVLAAHLCEPVRNFGIGGYSVYQTYLRMKREEARAPAECILFGVYEDDHFRSFTSWQSVYTGKNTQHIAPTLPHIGVDLNDARIREYPNACPTPESLYNLCDPDWVYDMFKDDFDLRTRLEYLEHVKEFPGDSLLDFGERTEYTRAALFGSMRIIDKVAEFAEKRKTKLLIVLSYGTRAITKAFRDGRRFDQEFVDYLQNLGLPYIDLLEAHKADFAKFSVGLEDYLSTYFIGHYNPLGNFFTAFATKDKLADMLDPRPISYQDP